MMIEEIDSDGSGTVDFDGRPLKFGSISIEREIVLTSSFCLFTEFMEVMTGGDD